MTLSTLLRYDLSFKYLGIVLYLSFTQPLFLFNDRFFFSLSDQINDDALHLLVDMLDKDGDGKIR